jgi:hypothetical protein
MKGHNEIRFHLFFPNCTALTFNFYQCFGDLHFQIISVSVKTKPVIVQLDFETLSYIRLWTDCEGFVYCKHL